MSHTQRPGFIAFAMFSLATLSVFPTTVAAHMPWLATDMP